MRICWGLTFLPTTSQSRVFGEISMSVLSVLRFWTSFHISTQCGLHPIVSFPTVPLIQGFCVWFGMTVGIYRLAYSFKLNMRQKWLTKFISNTLISLLSIAMMLKHISGSSFFSNYNQTRVPGWAQPLTKIMLFQFRMILRTQH